MNIENFMHNLELLDTLLVPGQLDTSHISCTHPYNKAHWHGQVATTAKGQTETTLKSYLSNKLG